MAAKGKAQDTFRAKAPGIMLLLMRDFKLATDDAAAILGNLGHESGGLVALQEIDPTVKGSRGGYGWAQWTGPRRRAYEAYCSRNKLDPASDKANYGFLFTELKGSERKALDMLRRAKGLTAKVKAFEQAYERAGVKHYASRYQWAAVALDAFAAAGAGARIPEWALPAAGKPADAPAPPEAPKPAPPPQTQPAPPPAPIVVEKPIVADPGELEKHPIKSKTVWQWIITTVIVPLLAVFNDRYVQLAIVAVVAGFAIYAIKRRWDLFSAVKNLKAHLE